MIHAYDRMTTHPEATRSVQFRQSVWVLTSSPHVREYLRNELETSSHFVAGRTLTSTREAIRQFRRMQPDILLIDIDGLSAETTIFIATIKRKFPRISQVVVSGSESRDQLFECLHAGASGYLVRTTTSGEGITRLTELILGGAPLSRTATRMLVEKFHHNYSSPLTRRETEVLQLVHEGKTFTQASDSLHVARETIKTHVRNIYVKLGVNCRADAIKKAIKERFI